MEAEKSKWLVLCWLAVVLYTWMRQHLQNRLSSACSAPTASLVQLFF